MSRYIEGQVRKQVTLLPECLDDFIAEENPIRVTNADSDRAPQIFNDFTRIYLNSRDMMVLMLTQSPRISL